MQMVIRLLIICIDGAVAEWNDCMTGKINQHSGNYQHMYVNPV